MPGRQRSVLRLLLHHPIGRALTEAAPGNACHFVGGLLRDRLLGLPSADFDAVVERDGEAVAERLATRLAARLVRLGGKEFAAFRLVGGDFELDLWDREGTPLAADLERRDFTVNALALDLRSGELLDPHAGLRDLHDRVLRAVGAGSFQSDPLRVLRLPRLLLQLPGFAAEPATVEAARRQSARLTEVAAERVREELRRIVASRDAHRGLQLLEALHVYPGLWLGQPGEGGPLPRAVSELEELESCALVVRRLAPAALPARVDREAARWAIVFAQLPRPLEAVRRFARAGYVLRQRADEAAALLLHDGLPADEIAQRHFLHDSGPLWATAAAYLGARCSAAGEGATWGRWLGALTTLLDRLGPWILDPPALLSGEEVLRETGVPRGPAVGRALAVLRRAQVEGAITSREDALALLRRTDLS